jgi:hypothetical protein
MAIHPVSSFSRRPHCSADGMEQCSWFVLACQAAGRHHLQGVETAALFG